MSDLIKNSNVKPCAYGKVCGACNGMKISYEDTLKEKEHNVSKLLSQYGSVLPIVPMENPFNYRHKVHAVFGRDKKKSIVCGTYKEGTHTIIPIKDCNIEDKLARQVIDAVYELVVSFGFTAYDEDRRKGLFRHVVVRRSHATNEVMVVLVTSRATFTSRRNFVNELIKKCPFITTIIHSINDKDTTFVLGSEQKVIYGNGFITDKMCGCSFRLSPSSFYQINPVQTQVMYDLAIEGARLKELPPGSLCLDTYCGIGTIGIIAAKSAPKARFIGAELNGEAVKDANRNAKLNGLDNISFVCKDATRFMVELARQRRKVDVVFMDPPRSGSTKEFIDALRLLKPQRISYISCCPETLATDMKRLTSIGYTMEKAIPVDNFSWTKHTEVVAILRRT